MAKKFDHSSLNVDDGVIEDAKHYFVELTNIKL